MVLTFLQVISRKLPTTKRLSYQISGLGTTTELEPEYISQTDQPVVLINKSKMYYELVIPKGINPSLFGELLVDFIEVSGSGIWGRNEGASDIQNRLESYNNIWVTDDVGSVYADKIKYFYTMDEPHSYDHFLPYKMVEDVQN